MPMNKRNPARTPPCSACSERPANSARALARQQVDAERHQGGGNYGEIFERNVGAGSALKLPRGLNGLWSKGGLMYAIPYR